MTNDNKYPKKKIKCELFNDHFENAKRYQTNSNEYQSL